MKGSAPPRVVYRIFSYRYSTPAALSPFAVQSSLIFMQISHVRYTRTKGVDPTSELRNPSMSEWRIKWVAFVTKSLPLLCKY